MRSLQCQRKKATSLKFLHWAEMVSQYHIITENNQKWTEGNNSRSSNISPLFHLTSGGISLQPGISPSVHISSFLVCMYQRQSFSAECKNFNPVPFSTDLVVTSLG